MLLTVGLRSDCRTVQRTDLGEFRHWQPKVLERVVDKVLSDPDGRNRC